MVSLLCVLYAPPVLGPRLSLNQMFFDVVRKNSKLHSHTRHILLLEVTNLRICVCISEFILVFCLRVLCARL